MGSVPFIISASLELAVNICWINYGYGILNLNEQTHEVSIYSVSKVNINLNIEIYKCKLKWYILSLLFRICCKICWIQSEAQVRIFFSSVITCIILNRYLSFSSTNSVSLKCWQNTCITIFVSHTPMIKYGTIWNIFNLLSDIQMDIIIIVNITNQFQQWFWIHTNLLDTWISRQIYLTAVKTT